MPVKKHDCRERDVDVYHDLESQLSKKLKLLITFSIAIDESLDITYMGQLAVFIHRVDEDIKIPEEFVELIPTIDTTMADDLYQSLVESLDRLGVDWKHAVSLVTYGAPQMISWKVGVAKIERKVTKTECQAGFLQFPLQCTSIIVVQLNHEGEIRNECRC
ncbi:General transcription factor II-I repeat domain-containing protein 2 [Thelohanellus kitauei]|uniref:General transcription factor II-I repeat domain-containing protein 2 n=1 Tax=Thelohanellus kitauei TaxID=669202 RepID=A0A0C2J1H1_THEKT|nr:General transcription factor II-I repeat domain-containing protein 2 [Thelohanellus kitauei]